MDISLALSISFHFVSKSKKKTGSIPVFEVVPMSRTKIKKTLLKK